MIDIFFEKLPKYTLHHSNPSSFYAIQEVRTDTGSYFHVLLTDEQYKYRVKNRLTCTTWTQMVASKPDRAGALSDCKDEIKLVPKHVFGDCIVDPIANIRIAPTKAETVVGIDKPSSVLGVVELKNE